MIANKLNSLLPGGERDKIKAMAMAGGQETLNVEAMPAGGCVHTATWSLLVCTLYRHYQREADLEQPWTLSPRQQTQPRSVIQLTVSNQSRPLSSALRILQYPLPLTYAISTQFKRPHHSKSRNTMAQGDSERVREAQKVVPSDPQKAEQIYKDIISKPPAITSDAAIREYELALISLGELYRDQK